MLPVLEDVYGLPTDEFLEDQLAFRCHVEVEPAQIGQVADVIIQAAPPIYDVRREAVARLGPLHLHPGAGRQVLDDLADRLVLEVLVGVGREQPLNAGGV